MLSIGKSTKIGRLDVLRFRNWPNGKTGFTFAAMAIPWHRFLKIGLMQVFSGTCFEVKDEFDVSDQKQLLDFVVVRRCPSGLPEPDPDHLPDGLQDLKDHNLITYKSMNEAFDRFALNELVGHAVAYSKLQAKDEWKSFGDQLGLIAVSTRKPSTEVISKLMHQTEQEDVYLIDCAGWQVSCVVVNIAPPVDRNWLWDLIKGDRSRWKSGSIAGILNLISKRLKNMETIDPEIEAFENQVLESWLEELPPEKRLIGLDLKSTKQGQDLIAEGVSEGAEVRAVKIALRMINAGKTDEEISELTELPLNTIEKLRKSADDK